MQYLIVANPTAGRDRAVRLANDVHQLLRQASATSRMMFTCAKGDAEALTLEALQQRPDTGNSTWCVVACGGDGTVQEVVNALLAAKNKDGSPLANNVVLGLAPGGRCNDFASAFGIRPDARHIVRVLLDGQARRIDLGRVGDRYFCTVATMGFDAAVSRFVNSMRTPLAGTIAYVYGVLCVLPFYTPVEARLVLDDSTVNGRVFLAASANTSSYGGHLRICPDADAGDGMLDLCLVAPIGRWRVLRLLHHVLRSKHASLPEVRLVRTRSVQIESTIRQEIWADGEFITETPVTVEAIPNAISLLVPNTKRS